MWETSTSAYTRSVQAYWETKFVARNDECTGSLPARLLRLESSIRFIGQILKTQLVHTKRHLMGRFCPVHLHDFPI
jgi:hypothetical protein